MTCSLLEKITFQSPFFSLQNFVYDDCPKLSEVEGLFKLVPVSELDEADLGHMQWIKSYQNYEVNLMFRNIIEGRICHIQMLYEYGIRSTYLKGITDQSMMTSEYTTLSSSLSFIVPLCPKKRRILGLNVTTLYRSDGQDKFIWDFYLRIDNITKGLTWVYNPFVYCNPGVDEDVVWLSYWPIGNMLDPSDEVNVDISVVNGIENGCGVSLVYDCTYGEMKQENDMKEKEIIGGDLSKFEVATGKYFLCRLPIVKSELLKIYFGHNIYYTDSQGWRKSLQSNYASFLERKASKDTHLKDIWLGGFTSETEIPKIKKAVSELVGVEFVTYDTNTKRLLVTGHVDPTTVVTCVGVFDNMVDIETYDYRDENALKRKQMERASGEILSAGLDFVIGKYITPWISWMKS